MPIFSALNLKLWAYIGTAAIIGLLIIALLATRGALSDAKHERDQATLKLSVSNASIGTLEGALKRMSDETKALANSDANRINASRQAIQLADAASQVREAARQRLLQSAEMIRPVGIGGSEECAVSSAVEAAWPAQ
jgi:hypothetical protein